MATGNRMSGMLSDYSQLRSVPALLSIAFAVASMFAFGGLSEVHVVWLDYTLTQNHAVLLSLVVYVVAFASSETNRFEYYSRGEQALLLSGPAIMLAQKFLPELSSWITSNQPLSGVGAFLIAFVGWVVMVR